MELEATQGGWNVLLLFVNMFLSLGSDLKSATSSRIATCDLSLTVATCEPEVDVPQQECILKLKAKCTAAEAYQANGAA